MENLVTLTVKSTHFYLIDLPGDGKLLVDAGWELGQFTAEMKAFKIPFADIRWVMFTHHHPDHAGLIQEVRNLSGARLIIHEKQIPFLESLRAFYARKTGSIYMPIRVEKNDLVSPTREQLHALGIPAELVETPGHSEDSISLLTDGGMAFIGDLHLPDFAPPETAELTRESWRRLLERGAQVFYPSHSAPVRAEQVKV